MTHCPRCGKTALQPDSIHTCTPLALKLADWLEHRTMKMLQDRQAAAELRRLYAENEALRGMSFDTKRDMETEALLRQALDTLAYWLEHGETPGAHDMIQRTHDALLERLK